jgi:hypothetical protein
VFLLPPQSFGFRTLEQLLDRRLEGMCLVETAASASASCTLHLSYGVTFLLYFNLYLKRSDQEGLARSLTKKVEVKQDDSIKQMQTFLERTRRISKHNPLLKLLKLLPPRTSNNDHFFSSPHALRTLASDLLRDLGKSVYRKVHCLTGIFF